jgi:hypothetical protein
MLNVAYNFKKPLDFNIVHKISVTFLYAISNNFSDACCNELVNLRISSGLVSSFLDTISRTCAICSRNLSHCKNKSTTNELHVTFISMLPHLNICM